MAAEWLTTRSGSPSASTSMDLLAHHFFGRIVRRLCRFLFRLQRLAVEPDGGCAGVPPKAFAKRHARSPSKSLPNPSPLNLRKMLLTRGVRREAIARQIENGIHHRAHVCLARPPAGASSRDQRPQPRPFPIRQIAGKPLALPIQNVARVSLIKQKGNSANIPVTGHS
jgi:hypothetical protein